jgi:hypothetical protein
LEDIAAIRTYGVSGSQMLSEMMMPNLGGLKEPILPDKKFINYIFLIIIDGTTLYHVFPIIGEVRNTLGYKRLIRLD